MSKTVLLEYHVAGMDCADCARKIEGMVNKTAGASQPKINFAAEKLELALDETITPRAELERRLLAIGYQPTLKGTPPATAASSHDHEDDQPAEQMWWASRPARLVLGSAAIFMGAFVLSLLEKNLGFWLFVAATLLNLYPVATRAWAGVRYGNPFGINTLATIAALGALGIGEPFEAALVLVLFNIGEWLEGVAAGQARSGIRALSKLTPKTAFVVHGDHIHETSADLLEVGQVVLVKPGARVPCDGTILSGSSALDDSPVTGESIPVSKSVGDAVFAGSINTDSALEVRVDKPASDNTIARIIKLVSEAEEGKGNTARFIDRFSQYWTPAVLLVSAVVAVLPPLLGLGAWHDWLYKGISLLLIGCPCALLLSVPAAITSGLSSAARRGVLVKGGQVLETVGAVSSIAFDKTGTLTAGKPKVTDFAAFGLPEADALRLAASIETTSSHPLALAIVQFASQQGVRTVAVNDAQAIQGKAVLAEVEARALAVGSPSYAASFFPLEPRLQKNIAALEEAGKTVVLLLESGVVLALFAIRDESRTDAKAGLAALAKLGIQTIMLTGDNPRTGRAVAQSLGIEVQAGLLPEEKLAWIAAARQSRTIAMVGDGINDAPALALADVGIAMGSGTDVALETAGAAVLRNSIVAVAQLVELARATMQTIRQNIGFALGLKLFFLLTTILGYSTLWMAILADTGATVLVTVNAMRLLGFRSRF